jgi:hypothetical protein
MTPVLAVALALQAIGTLALVAHAWAARRRTRDYLDSMILHWRRRFVSGDAHATFYVDAFQSARVSLLGSPLPLEQKEPRGRLASNAFPAYIDEHRKTGEPCCEHAGLLHNLGMAHSLHTAEPMIRELPPLSQQPPPERPPCTECGMKPSLTGEVVCFDCLPPLTGANACLACGRRPALKNAYRCAPCIDAARQPLEERLAQRRTIES